jgi:hypothetical protein
VIALRKVVAKQLFDGGMYQESLLLRREALEACRRTHPEIHYETASAHAEVATGCLHCGIPQDGVEHMEKVRRADSQTWHR